jgi:hypothetical protein
VEGRAFLERNGYKIGLFGLTAPKNYGAADSIYPADTSFDTLLTETQMSQDASYEVASIRQQNVDVVLGLAHIDVDGSVFQKKVTGCKQLILPISAGHNALGLASDVLICGHDHALERAFIIPNRGDGRPAWPLEAGSIQTCNKDNVFLNQKDCTSLIPRPRLGKAVVRVLSRTVVLDSVQFIDLKPRRLGAGKIPEPGSRPGMAAAPGVN